ncbi:MAG: response regulator [Bacteroidia bacterium]
MAYKNILLVDDDDDDQEIFLAALGEIDKSIKCTIAGNGREALEMLNNGLVNPDIILLDLNMPVMNGQQFLLEINQDKKHKGIPVIILSTTSHNATIELVMDMGAQQFFSKPDSFEGLISILKSILI